MSESIVESEKIDPPEWISVDAKKVWDDLAPELTKLGLLSRLDRFAFVRYCDGVAEWRRIAKTTLENGLTYRIDKQNEFGEISQTIHKERPEISIKLKLSAELLRLEREFGLTPAARAALSIHLSRQSEMDNDPFAVD